MVVPLAVFVLLVTALWLLMAVGNKVGRSWARQLSTAFFIFYTVSLTPLPILVIWSAGDSPNPRTSSLQVWDLLLGIIAPILIGWAIGLVAVVLLWRRASSGYFAAVGTRPNTDGGGIRNLVQFQPVPQRRPDSAVNPKICGLSEARGAR